MFKALSRGLRRGRAPAWALACDALPQSCLRLLAAFELGNLLGQWSNPSPCQLAASSTSTSTSNEDRGCEASNGLHRPSAQACSTAGTSGGSKPWGPSPLRGITATIKTAGSCAEIWALLQQPGLAPGMKTLSQALDCAVQLGASPTSSADWAAVQSLLRAAAGQLPEFDSWGLVSFIRFNAAFEGLLSADVLSAWQAQLQQPEKEAGLTVQGLSNTLLSLGTVAASNEDLAAVVDGQLVRRLWERVLRALCNGQGVCERRDPPNALYGVALLAGVPRLTGTVRPSRDEIAAALAAVRRHVRSLTRPGLVQVALGCAKLVNLEVGQAPPWEHPYFIYYPGGELLEAVLERALHLGQSMDARALSQILASCGALGYHAKPEVKQVLTATLLSRPDFGGREAGVLLAGYVRLGEPPAPEVMTACYEVVLRDGPSDARSLAHAAWAGATLQVCSLDMVRGLASLLGAHPCATVRDLCMWHSAYLHLKLRYGRDAVVAALPPGLLERSLAAHRQVRSEAVGEGAGCAPEATHFHRCLAEAVQRVAPKSRVEVESVVQDPEGEGLGVVDILLPDEGIVVEADGPVHFLRNGELRGETRARNRLLGGWGLSVVGVPYYVFDEVHARAGPGRTPSREEIVQHLERYL